MGDRVLVNFPYIQHHGRQKFSLKYQIQHHEEKSSPVSPSAIIKMAYGLKRKVRPVDATLKQTEIEVTPP